MPESNTAESAANALKDLKDQQTLYMESHTGSNLDFDKEIDRLERELERKSVRPLATAQCSQPRPSSKALPMALRPHRPGRPKSVTPRASFPLPTLLHVVAQVISASGASLAVGS